MGALIIHSEWALAKRMAVEWHPLGQFQIFLEGTGMLWHPIFFPSPFDKENQNTIDQFSDFCAKWQPELEKRGVKLAEPPED